MLKFQTRILVPEFYRRCILVLVKNVMLNVVYGETVRYHNSTMGVLGPPGETRFGGPDFLTKMMLNILMMDF